MIATMTRKHAVCGLLRGRCRNSSYMRDVFEEWWKIYDHYLDNMTHGTPWRMGERTIGGHLMAAAIGTGFCALNDFWCDRSSVDLCSEDRPGRGDLWMAKRRKSLEVFAELKLRWTARPGTWKPLRRVMEGGESELQCSRYIGWAEFEEYHPLIMCAVLPYWPKGIVRDLDNELKRWIFEHPAPVDCYDFGAYYWLRNKGRERGKGNESMNPGILLFCREVKCS